MDSEPINSVSKPNIPVRGPRPSSTGSSQSVPPPVPNNPVDTVSLTPRSQVLSQTGAPQTGDGKEDEIQIDSNQRKYTITDDNEVVLKIIDSQTKEVVRQIPSEEQLKLKNAIRDLTSEIVDNNEPVV